MEKYLDIYDFSKNSYMIATPNAKIIYDINCYSSNEHTMEVTTIKRDRYNTYDEAYKEAIKLLNDNKEKYKNLRCSLTKQYNQYYK